MNTVKVAEGKLITDVSSEGNYIPTGTSVVVNEVIDKFKNIYYEVISMRTKVKMPYYDTDAQRLVQA